MISTLFLFNLTYEFQQPLLVSKTLQSHKNCHIYKKLMKRINIALIFYLIYILHSVWQNVRPQFYEYILCLCPFWKFLFIFYLLLLSILSISKYFNFHRITYTFYIFYTIQENVLSAFFIHGSQNSLCLKLRNILSFNFNFRF